MNRMAHDKTYKCEVCEVEISEELARFTEDICDWHRFCHEHKRMYLDVKHSVLIHWNGEKFVPTLSK